MKQVRTTLKLLAILVALAIQNIAIFHRHYFQGIVFPDDFLLTYHAVPSYWIEALGHGRDIAWIPVQAMGYPIYMALQSGYGYLPLRAFAWLGLSYTLHGAVVLQGLHVLLGALGAVVCARLVGAAWRHALLAGVLYQCFGGFYSNAQHPDIVRSFALLPWLCAPVFADWRHPSRLFPLCTALLPLWVYAQFTGGYPGAAIASTLLLGGMVVLRVAVQVHVRRAGGFVLLAQCAGLLLAGWVILPAAMDASLVDRTAEVGQLQYDYLQVRDLLALTFPVDSRFFAHDLSMRSVFLALPGLLLIPAGGRRLVRLARWPLLCAGVALLIATGPLHQVLTAIVPPAGLSRFVMADYRGFVVLGLIVAGVQGLALQRGERGWRIWPLVATGLLLAGVHILGLSRPYAPEDGYAQLLLLAVSIGCCMPALRLGSTFAFSGAALAGLVAVWEYQQYMGFVVPATSSELRWLFVAAALFALAWIPRSTRGILAPGILVAAMLAGMATLYQIEVARPDPNGQVVTLCVLAAAALLVVAELRGTALGVAGVVVLAVLTLADWRRVTWDQHYFAPPLQDGVQWLEVSLGPMQRLRSELDARLAAQACRPERLDPPEASGPAVWAGYYDGKPHLRDHGIKLIPQKTILADADLRAFAKQPWRMVDLPRAALPKPAALANAAPAAGAACVRAGTTDAQYRVDAASPQRLVENEIYWPGWKAVLTCVDRCPAGRTLTLEPASTMGFRTWDVPAGVWQMDLTFVTPHRAAGWAATGLGLASWLLLCLLLARGAWLNAPGTRSDSAGTSPGA